MMQRNVAPLFVGGGFFESPRWHEGRWWVSDYFRHSVSAIDTNGNEEVKVTLTGEPGGLGWLPDGTLLVVSRLDRQILAVDQKGTLELLVDLSEMCGGSLNDMVIDGSGHIWAGDVGFELRNKTQVQTTSLKRIDQDGSVTIDAIDLVCPNGMVVAADGSTLIVSESFASRLTAYTISTDGSLSHRRVWAQLAPSATLGPFSTMFAASEVIPDGCTLDAEGAVWVADGAGQQCLRVAEGGEILDVIAAPEGLNIYACALGGDDGCTLLMCAAPDFAVTHADPRRAVLLTATVTVPHAGYP